MSAIIIIIPSQCISQYSIVWSMNHSIVDVSVRFLWEREVCQVRTSRGHSTFRLAV